MDTSEEWDRIFSGLNEETAGKDPWLERWWRFLDASRGSPVLGAGLRRRARRAFPHRARVRRHRRELLGRGAKTHARAPAAKTQNVDLTPGLLPFPDAHFGVIVASLSLHYFPWHQTTRILDDVCRCLKSDGYLLTPLQLDARPPLLRRRKTGDRRTFLSSRRDAQAPLRRA